MFDFPYYRYLFECRVTSPILSFTSRRGETIKGLLSGEMKKLFPCAYKAGCHKCDSVADCDYPRFFHYQLCKSPYAYTIIPSLNPRSVYYQGETFSFEIRLFGECAKSVFLINYLAPSIEQGGLLTGMGNWYLEKFGRFQMSKIFTWHNMTWRQVFQEDKGFLQVDAPVQYFSEMIEPGIHEYNQLRFYTPFCLKVSKKSVKEPDLKDIVYFAVMRLRAVMGDRKLMLSQDIYDMAEQATKISSEFEKTDSVKNTPYYIGQMALENIPKELRPILTVGSFCHIGKGATQGYGGYFLR